MSTQATEQMSDEDARAAVLATIARQQAEAKQQWQRDAAGRFKADPAKARAEAIYEASVRADKAAAEIRADSRRPDGARRFSNHRALLGRTEAQCHAAMTHAHQQAVDAIVTEKAELRAKLFADRSGGAKLLAIPADLDRKQAVKLARAAATMGDIGLLRALAVVASQATNPKGQPAAFDDAIYPIWASVDPEAKALRERSDELDAQLAGMSTPTYRLGGLEDNDAAVDRAVAEVARRAEDELAATVRGDTPPPERVELPDKAAQLDAKLPFGQQDSQAKLRAHVEESLARSGTGGDDWEE